MFKFNNDENKLFFGICVLVFLAVIIIGPLLIWQDIKTQEIQLEKVKILNELMSTMPQESSSGASGD